MKPQPNRQPRGRYRKSVEARTTIVNSAIEQLIDQGYHNFSLRKVAVRAGISIGKLQHQFPSKEELIREMLDVVISGYLDDFASVIESSASAEEQLYKVLKHVVDDLTTKETTIFFPELWSLANHEPVVCDLMNEMYGRYQNVYHGIIRAINPELSDEQIEKTALFIAASLEGHTIFVGYEKDATDYAGDITEMAYDCYLHMIKTGNVPG